jgi:hypothetical protein
MRTPQQKIGDRLEQAALAEAKKWFADAKLTVASGSTYNDGDLAGVSNTFIDCKGSDTPGKGLSVSKADWKKIKQQAARLTRIPIHLGLDHDGEIVAFIPWGELLALLYQEATAL